MHAVPFWFALQSMKIKPWQIQSIRCFCNANGIGTLHTALDVDQRCRASIHHKQIRMFERHPSRVAHQGDDLVSLIERMLDDQSTRETRSTEHRYSRHGHYHLSIDGRRSSSKVQASRGWLCNHQ
jgi:hypothetical protein